jgi:hypothetical protein
MVASPVGAVQLPQKAVAHVEISTGSHEHGRSSQLSRAAAAPGQATQLCALREKYWPSGQSARQAPRPGSKR